MGINLAYVEGNSEKPQRFLRSHKIKSTFCTESTFHKLLCKPNSFKYVQHKHLRCPMVGEVSLEM